MRLLLLDTEFTDFINTEMISMGIVSEDGKHEFYIELNDYRPQVCSEFVKMNIIPRLDQKKYGVSRIEASARLYCWLEELGEEYAMCPDNIVDWEIFVDLIEEIPPNIQNTPVMMWTELRKRIMAKADQLQTPDLNWFFSMATQAFHDGFREYFLRNPSPKQHHSLADSKANRSGWIKAHQWLDQHY